MPELKESFEQRVKNLTSKERWGDDALPAMTMRQARSLMDALADMYAVGVLHGQQLLRKRMAQLGHALPTLVAPTIPAVQWIFDLTDGLPVPG